MTAIWDLQNGHRTFEEPTLKKAFYHPSPKRGVDASDRKTKLSPERMAQNTEEKVDPYRQDFIKGSNVYRPGHARPLNWSQDSPSFSESWPDSERPSIVDDQSDQATSFLSGKERINNDVKSKGLDRGSPKRLNVTGGHKEEGESVLSKYVQRFRKAAPQSREDRSRSKVADPRDFWWLHDTSLSGGEESRARAVNVKDSRLQSKLNDPRHLSDSGKIVPTQNNAKLVEDWLDKETQSLHSKTDILLERAESTLSSLSSHPIVSTAGLGSEPSTSAGSMFAEEPYRPRFTMDIGPPSLPDPVSVGPDDDILEQWRRRRLADQARERIKQVDSDTRDIPHVQKQPDITSTIEALCRRLGLDIQAPLAGATVAAALSVRNEVSKPAKKDADVQTSSMRDADVQTSTVDDDDTANPHVPLHQPSNTFPHPASGRDSHSRSVSPNRSRTPQCRCANSWAPVGCPHVMSTRENRDRGVHYVEPHLHMHGDVISTDSRPQQKLRRSQVPKEGVSREGQGDFLDNPTVYSDDSDWSIGSKEGLVQRRAGRSTKGIDRDRDIDRHRVRESERKGNLGSRGESGKPSAPTSRRKTTGSCDLVDTASPRRVHSDAVPPHRLPSDAVPHRRIPSGVTSPRILDRAEMFEPISDDFSFDRENIEKPTEQIESDDIDVIATKDSDQIRSDVVRSAEDVKPNSHDKDSIEEGLRRNNPDSRHMSDRPRGHRSKERATRRGPEGRHKLPSPRFAVSSPTQVRNDLIGQVVEDHLFEMSDSLTVVSSFENYPPHQESAWLQLDSPTTPKQQRVDSVADQGQDSVEDLESSILSDGDEFCDDSIMVDLRKRRSLYLDLLKQLDKEIQLQRD